MSMVVVLPAPFGPRKATISPGSMVRSRPSTAMTEPKRLVTPRRATAGTAPPGAPPGAALVGAERVMRRASAVRPPNSSSSDHDSPMTAVTPRRPHGDLWYRKPPSAAGEAGGEVAGDGVQADPLLTHGVALPHGHRVVGERVEVDRQAERRADLVLPAVAAADR